MSVYIAAAFQDSRVQTRLLCSGTADHGSGYGSGS